uniref:Elongation factor Tu n=1 Tax=Lygus hesperus TaxID=30085 RepID=A0A0A9YXM2_LYGHE
MHTQSPVSSRYFMTQLQGVLISAALPLFDRGFDSSSIPPCYLLYDDSSFGSVTDSSSTAKAGTVVNFGKEVERIAHYDTHHPLPTPATDRSSFRPFVHLFYLATRVITLCATVFTDEHERDQRSAFSTHVSSAQRDMSLANKSMYEALLASVEMSRERL